GSFFFSSRRRHTRSKRDWSSDVCSSDLGETYDVVFDVVGKSSFSACVKSLKGGGVYLLGNPGLSQQVRGLWTSITTSKKVVGGMVSYRKEDLVFLKELAEAGKIRRSEEHTSELQSRFDLVCRLLLEKKKKNEKTINISHAPTTFLYNDTPTTVIYTLSLHDALPI